MLHELTRRVIGCHQQGTLQQQAHHQQQDQCGSDQSISRASYMCRKCKVHGKLVPVKRHKRTCLYMHCKCIKCLLVDQGRKVVARQIALYRDQKHTGGPEDRSGKEPPGLFFGKEDLSAPTQQHQHQSRGTSKTLHDQHSLVAGPHCRRCRNHNVTVIWKNHKKACPYRHCPCDPCRLINVRKDTEKTLRDMQIVTTEEGSRSKGGHGGRGLTNGGSSQFEVQGDSRVGYYSPPPPPPLPGTAVSGGIGGGSGQMYPQSFSPPSTFQRLVAAGHPHMGVMQQQHQQQQQQLHQHQQQQQQQQQQHHMYPFHGGGDVASLGQLANLSGSFPVDLFGSSMLHHQTSSPNVDCTLSPGNNNNNNDGGSSFKMGSFMCASSRQPNYPHSAGSNPPPFEYGPPMPPADVWSCLGHPARSTAFSSYSVAAAADYCSTSAAYSYLNSLGMGPAAVSSSNHQEPPQPSGAPSLDEGSTVYRAFSDYCY